MDWEKHSGNIKLKLNCKQQNKIKLRSFAVRTGSECQSVTHDPSERVANSYNQLGHLLKRGKL